MGSGISVRETTAGPLNRYPLIVEITILVRDPTKKRFNLARERRGRRNYRKLAA